MKIGIALSGGGVRALIFHLGVLKRLAEEQKFNDVTQISTVSGGSLGMGLIFNINGLKWPSDEIYLESNLPQIRKLLTTKRLQGWMILLSILLGFVIRPSAKILAWLLQHYWGIKGTFGDLGDSPQWWINATSYQTGVNWRFSKEYVGDYQFTRSQDTNDIRISKALAASAAFPGLIGPIVYKPNWGKRGRIHLWDGGVYDNLGTEVLYKIGEGFQKGIDTLFVSDGGPKPGWQRRWFHKAWRRLIEIPMNQVRGLRSRTIVDHFINHPKSGAYFQMGNTVEYIFHKGTKIPPPGVLDHTLSQENVDKAAQFKTTLRRVKETEYDLLFRHGYEVANATLHVYMDLEYKGFE